MADFEKLNDGSHRVNVMTGEVVVISKLYGPTIFADISVKAVLDNSPDEAYWIVYRGDKEWCRIPAQLDEDFDDDGEESEQE